MYRGPLAEIFGSWHNLHVQRPLPYHLNLTTLPALPTVTL